MQKLIIILALFAAAATTQAQTQVGNFVVGANSNLSFTSTDFGGDDNTNGFDIGLSGGYFVIDNLAGGLVFEYSRSSTGDFSSSTTAIGPFVRYYIANVFASVAYQHAVLSVDSDGDDSSESGGQVGLQAGYAIFIKDVVAIEPNLNYTIGTGDLLEDVNQFGINVGFSLYF